jgi:hypothetical protein
MKIKLLTIAILAVTLLTGSIGVQKYISSQIASGVKREMPNASGVSASVPLADVPSNLTSDSIKSAEIGIDKYSLKESKIDTSLEISASNISKSKPTLIGSLDITATIPLSTITKSSGFSDAQIVGNTLQVSAGSGGLGRAILTPKYSNNQLYFELKSVSLFGNEIPASSLPATLQDEIKSKSQRNLTAPKGLKVKSVSLSSKGLSVKMFGSNVQLGNLGSVL